MPTGTPSFPPGALYIVIQLNLVRSTLAILDTVQAEMDDPSSSDKAAEDLSKENKDGDGDTQMQDP